MIWFISEIADVLPSENTQHEPKKKDQSGYKTPTKLPKLRNSPTKQTSLHISHQKKKVIPPKKPSDTPKKNPSTPRLLQCRSSISLRLCRHQPLQQRRARIQRGHRWRRRCGRRGGEGLGHSGLLRLGRLLRLHLGLEDGDGLKNMMNDD
jgi:hypothetical protein